MGKKELWFTDNSTTEKMSYIVKYKWCDFFGSEIFGCEIHIFLN
jgi:hypothetical protein